MAATTNILLPVGADYTPPNNWITASTRLGGPLRLAQVRLRHDEDFIDPVRAELSAETGRKPSPQTRDMNPIYTGKDVSYIDTKQAQRAAEVAALDAEKLRPFADLLGLGGFAEASLDKVWRQLAYGAHHDGITGSESDQVYIDLLTGLARGARPGRRRARRRAGGLCRARIGTDRRLRSSPRASWSPTRCRSPVTDLVRRRAAG